MKISTMTNRNRASGPLHFLHLAAAGFLAAAVFLSAGGRLRAEAQPGPGDIPPFGASHLGKFLVATPAMPDPRFQRTVILIIRHDRRGALGLVVNRVLSRVKLSELSKRFGVKGLADGREVELHYGGPVEPERAFVIHTLKNGIKPVFQPGGNIGVSPFKDVLQAMARGEGPRRALFAVGYAGWAPGQLEAEIRRGGWFAAPVDEDILFGKDHATKWQRAREGRYRTL